MPGMEHITRIFGKPAGLTAREAQDFGPAAYIEAVVRRDESTLKRFREVSEMVRAAHGTPPDNMNYIAIAPEALVGVQKRDLTAAGVSGSNYLVATEQPAFVDALRSRGLVGRLPISVIDMTGNAAVPTIGASTNGWLADEDAQSADANINIGAIAATPKHVAARFTVSHQFHRQTTDAARRALDTELALGVDATLAAAMIAGSGSNGQPLGIVGTANVASQSGGTIAWSAVATLQAGVDAFDTADCYWVIGSGAAAVLRQRTRESGSGRFIFDDDRIAGKPTIVHSAVPTATAVVGCWRRLAVLNWGPLEIAVDPYSSFSTGKLTVGVRQLLDFAVLSPTAFGKAESIS